MQNRTITAIGFLQWMETIHNNHTANHEMMEAAVLNFNKKKEDNGIINTPEPSPTRGFRNPFKRKQTACKG